MTPVEEIRQAAQLMRERAQAATPGPWTQKEEPFDFEIEPHVSGGDCGCGGGIGYAPDATHIASWHPGVADAVADLLNQAAALRERWDEFSSIRNPQMAPALTHKALAVARAYLGGAA